MVVATPIKIEVHRPTGTPIGDILNEVRSWLDRNRIEPIEFKTAVGREGIGFEIRYFVQRMRRNAFNGSSRSRPIRDPYRPNRRFPLLIGPHGAQEPRFSESWPGHTLRSALCC